MHRRVVVLSPEGGDGGEAFGGAGVVRVAPVRARWPAVEELDGGGGLVQ